MALVANAQGLAGLRRVLKRGSARVPGHVPRGHIPIEEGSRLKGSYRIEKRSHAAPLGSFPCIVGLDPEKGGQWGAETAQSRQKAQLSDLFAQIEVESGSPQPSLSLALRPGTFLRAS